MKRFAVLALVLTLVLGFSTIMFAEEEFGTDCSQNPCLPKSACYIVKVYNPLQGIIEGLNDCVQRAFPCGDNSSIEAVVDFSVRSNGFLVIGLELEPFTSQTFTQPGIPKIATTANLWQGNHNRISVSNAVPSGTHAMADAAGYLPSGRGVRNYNLKVKGTTGNIEDQPWGEYKAVVCVTLSAP